MKSVSILSISTSNKNIPFNEKFKFFMTTIIPNTNYSSETSFYVNK